MAGELIAQFTDHEGRVSRFTERWSDLPDLEELAKSYLKQLQDIEDAAFEVLLERELEAAVGVQLTINGKIVGQPRTTSDDDRFRTAIRARIAINLSDGTPEDLIRIMSLLLVDGETFEIREEPPAQTRMIIHTPLTSADHDLIRALLDEGDPAGSRLLVEWNNSLAADTDKLTFADVPPATSSGGTLGSTTGATTDPGGFSSVI